MSSRAFSVIENQWITLRDGTQLAARIWMPDNAEHDPVPAVFEFLPYRKADGTCLRDESTYPVFAAAGIAGVRVDIRGSGESDGIIDGEYTPLELENACELIDWIAAQPWSNGHVGMMGISWGGFNSLQTAALRPKPLKAVISIASTVDRYNDDIHYKNGTHLSAQLSWAATMLGYQSRSPDPAIVGDRWRDMWMERMENEPFFMEEWLTHQTRDDFWKHGSICEDFSQIDIPVMVIAGWADGYRNTPIKLLEGLGSKAKALIGPWVHKYPHFAWPKPRADFHGEAIAFWNRHLRGIENHVEDGPQMRAYILQSPKPKVRREFDPGFWVAKHVWSKPQMQAFHIGAANTLTEGRQTANAVREVSLSSAFDLGTTSGEYFTLKPDAEMAVDQRVDDTMSLTFDSAPLTEAQAFLGMPVIDLDLSSDKPLANLVARIVDIHPDGTATRVTFGVLNLAHRRSNEHPSPLVPGEKINIRMELDACGYEFQPGHKIRLSLSTAYWPMILPPPEKATLTIDAASLILNMPLLGTHEKITVKEPDNPDPLPKYIDHTPPATRRSVERDLMTGETHYYITEDTGLSEHPGTGLSSRQLREEIWTQHPDNPLSSRGISTWTCDMSRPGWFVRTVSTARISCTATDWIISAEITAFEGERQVFTKTYEKSVKREWM
jgi:putative CocE/NonD family hydrolase